MQKISLILLSFLLMASLPLPACAGESIEIQQCTHILLRSSDGWWIAVTSDGSGSYGYGAGMARVEVNKNTFDFERVKVDIEGILDCSPTKAEDPYMAVSCWTKGATSEIEHRLKLKIPLLTRLLLAARKNARPPTDEFETRAYEQVEALWRGSRWKELSPEER